MNPAELPGTRAHLDRVSADLDAGFTCLWLVPDALVASGTAEDLLSRLAARSDSARVDPPGALERRVVAAPPPDAGEPPDWAVGHPAFEDPVVTPEPVLVPAIRLVDRVSRVVDDEGFPLAVVCAWEEDDPDAVGALLSRMSAAGGPARALVAARPRDVRSTAPDPLTTRTHWWWGVVGRLDTAVAVAAHRPPGPGLRDLVAHEVLVEVAGPDLDLAADLAVAWDGEPESLADVVKAVDGPPVPDRRRDGARRPPADLLDAWECGLVDLWEGRVRVSPRAVGDRREAVLRSLVWRAQHRALTPVLDVGRAEVEAVFRTRASTAVLAEVSPDPQAALELGPMHWAATTGRRVTLPAAERELLCRLRAARNALAHLTPLSGADLDRLDGVWTR